MTSLATGSPEARSGSGSITCGTPAVNLNILHADDLDATGDEMKSVEERFWAKVEKTESCWIWVGPLNWRGYGTVRPSGGGTRMAHRVIYECLRGPIPDGLTLDHLCRVRRCVNPEHLEPVTLKENILRGLGPTAINAKKEYCPRGHPLSGDNLVKNKLRRGMRECRLCHLRSKAEWQRRYRKKRSGK